VISSRAAIASAAAWLLLLVFAIALSALAASHNTLQGDRGLATWLQDQPFPGQTLSDGVRAVTQTEVILVLGAVAALVLWVTGYRSQAVILALGLVTMGVLEVGLKGLVDRPRPDPELVERRAGFDSSGSFPSGHVLATTFFYGAVTYFALSNRLERMLGWALIAVSCFFLVTVPLASVWLGVHWPSDILGSWAWAALLLALLIAADHTIAVGRVRFPRTFTSNRASWPRDERHN